MAAIHSDEFKRDAVRIALISDNAAYRAVATGLWPIKQSSKVPSYARAHARHTHVRYKLQLGDKMGDRRSENLIKAL
jgi:hypothetical protein